MENREGQVLVLFLHLHRTRKEAQARVSSVCNKPSSLLLSLRLAYHLDLHFPHRCTSSQPFSNVLSQMYLREMPLHETEIICRKISTPAVTPLSATPRIVSAHTGSQCNAAAGPLWL